MPGGLPECCPVIVFPSSGTGAREAAIVNTLSPGDRVLMYETGHFATLWRAVARRLKSEVEFVPATGGVPRRSVLRIRSDTLRARLASD
jgi:alanine-glyoxylate transaminase/serine-glyoxylate transaminase/serine-pyruvate transaminase